MGRIIGFVPVKTDAAAVEVMAAAENIQLDELAEEVVKTDAAAETAADPDRKAKKKK